MLFYILVLIFLLIIGFFDRSIKNKDNRLHLLRITCIVLFVIAAIRANSVGADTLQYTQIFNWVKSLKFSELNQVSGYWWDSGDSLEYSYKVYNKIISLFFNSEQAITIFNSLFLVLGLYLMIKNNSKDYWLSLFLFYSLGLYQLSLNLTPSFIAALFVFSGWKYLNKKGFLKFIFLSLIGLIFHTTALFVVVICILSKFLKLNQGIFILILISSFIIIFFGYPFISENILMHIVPSKYIHYLYSDKVNLDQLLVLAVHTVILICSLIVCFHRTGEKEVFVQKSQYIWFFIFEFIFYCFAIKNTYFSRVAFLISPFICIIIPEIIEYSKLNDKTYVNDSFYAKESSFMNVPILHHMSSFIIIILSFQYVARLYINNIGLTLPYAPFW